MSEYHHITANGQPLCAAGIDRLRIPCLHVSEKAAKPAILRLIEQNPDFRVGGYKVVQGYCPGTCPNNGWGFSNG